MAFDAPCVLKLQEYGMSVPAYLSFICKAAFGRAPNGQVFTKYAYFEMSPTTSSDPRVPGYWEQAELSYVSPPVGDGYQRWRGVTESGRLIIMLVIPNGATSALSSTV